jgi:diguanylate cyclase (GGDEF)-like protein
MLRSSDAVLRWLTASSLLLVVGLLVASGAGRGPEAAAAAHTLSLLVVALSVYGWLILPAGGSAALSAVGLLAIAWAWAILRAATLGLDLAAGAALIGLAAWRRRGRRRWRLRMEQKLEDLAEEAAVKEQAISLAGQAREALQKKLNRYTQLQAVAAALSNLTDQTAIAQLAVDRAFELIGKSDVCLLFLVEPERQELALCASRRHEAIQSVRAKHGDQFDRYVLRTHRPLLVSDVRRDFRFTVSLSPDRTITSVIACPLMLGQAAEGVLRLDAARAGAYTQDDLRFLDVLLDLVAAAMANARLFARTQQLAATDGLTGLALRRPFLEQLTRELTRAARSRDEVSLLLLDVDRFKDYNDTFGHQAGDVILRSIAQILGRLAPPEALSARYGGEEFAVLLPKAKRAQAADLAEHIRRAVEESQPLPPARESRSRAQRAAADGRAVTVSIGVASFPEDAQAELELVRVADQRLYQAKHGGRNLTCAS